MPMEGGRGGDPPPQAPISYLVTYELFETLMYCDPTPHARNPMGMYAPLPTADPTPTYENNKCLLFFVSAGQAPPARPEAARRSTSLRGDAEPPLPGEQVGIFLKMKCNSEYFSFIEIWRTHRSDMKTLSGPVYSQKPSDTKHHFLEGQVNLKKLEYNFFRIKILFFCLRSTDLPRPPGTGPRCRSRRSSSASELAGKQFLL